MRYDAAAFGTRSGSVVGVPPIARPRFVTSSFPGRRYSCATYAQSRSQVSVTTAPRCASFGFTGSASPSQCATTPRRDSSSASFVAFRLVFGVSSA